MRSSRQAGVPRRGGWRGGVSRAAGLLAAVGLGAAGAYAQAQASSEALPTATRLVRAGRYDEALAEIRKGLRARPGDPRLLTVEGVAYSMKGQDEEALTALRAALKSQPGFPAALRTEAEILSRRQDPAAAGVLREILRATPGDATAREMLATAEAEGGNCRAALEDFAAVRDAVEEHPVSLGRYGACLFEARRYPEASTAFGRLLQRRPEDKSTRYDLALAQSRAGDNAAARKTLEPLLAEAPDVDTLLLASDVAEDNGDTPQAAALMRQAIVADPRRADSYVRFAELCMAHESYQAGVDMVSAGVSRLPQAASLYLARGLLYGGMAQYDKAEADFRAAEQYDPQHGTGAYAVALVQTQRNNPEDALRTVREGLKQHPEDAQLQYLLARTLVEAGAQPGSATFREAQRAGEDAARLDPKLVQAHDLLARLYMESGQHALAVTQCRAALALDPADGNALYRLMRSLRETGDTEGAQAVGKQVAEMHQRARQEETSRLRYRIEGTTAGPAATQP